MTTEPESEALVAQQKAFVDRYGVTPAKADHATLLKMIEDYLNEGLKTRLSPFLRMTALSPPSWTSCAR